jgi:hypothetical protein
MRAKSDNDLHLYVLQPSPTFLISYIQASSCSQTPSIYYVDEVFGFGAVWIFRSYRRFGETCCLHLQELNSF